MKRLLAGIETLMVQEARTPESGAKAIRDNHARMGMIGRRHGIRVLNMHRYVNRHYDEGFLWWDHVHLTSFGHTLVAERLADVIWEEFLGELAARPER